MGNTRRQLNQHAIYLFSSKGLKAQSWKKYWESFKFIYYIHERNILTEDKVWVRYSFLGRYILYWPHTNALFVILLISDHTCIAIKISNNRSQISFVSKRLRSFNNIMKFITWRNNNKLYRFLEILKITVQYAFCYPPFSLYLRKYSLTCDYP